MSKIVELGPHSNMTPEECLELCRRDHASYETVIVIGINADQGVFLRSSHVSREEAVFITLDALDRIRGLELR